MKSKRIGLFGGTFNPVHLGHTTLAQAAKNHLRLDVVYFVPNAIPAHKSYDIASSAKRIQMLQLALDGFDWAQIDLSEIKRGGVSHTIDTMEIFRAAHPSCKLYLLVGFDAYLKMSSWHRGSEILQNFNIAVIPRENFLVESMPENVCLLPLATLGISASYIRKNIRDQGKLDGLLSPKVLKYINKNGLYQ